eukprot:4832632-Pyramimonas_sp.AAC.1
MRGEDGTFYMKPHDGGMKGDRAFIVNALLDSFQSPAQYFSAAMQMRSGTSLLAGALPDDDEVDLSHCSYPDGLHQVRLGAGCGSGDGWNGAAREQA